MDFCRLLHTAQKNDKNSANGARYYSTKFEPPKKLTKKTTSNKELSSNVKKFLERKEAEERQKAEEAQRKKEELLALRAQDKKAVKRVSIMLKSTKSANKSVIQDAVDNTNTAVTLAGPDQPDEDDYGYVSQEASDLYTKMMEKYKSMPEEPKFKKFEKKVSTNLTSTKDRVKAALEREREEALHPHRRKRKRKEGGLEEGEDGKDKDDDKETKYEEKESEAPPKPKPKPRPAPPPMSFTDLLKIAEKKQHEPIIIEKKEKEEEKLLTKKQRKLAEQERDYRERKEAREREASKSTGEKSKLEARLTENPKGPSKQQSWSSKPSNSDNNKPSSSSAPKNSESFKIPQDPPRNQAQSSGHNSSKNGGNSNKYPPNGTFKSSSSQSSVPSKSKPPITSSSAHGPRNSDKKIIPFPSNRSEVNRSNTNISSSSKLPHQKPIASTDQPRIPSNNNAQRPVSNGHMQRPSTNQMRPRESDLQRPSNQVRAKESDVKKRPMENQRPSDKRPTEGAKRRPPPPLNPYMDPADRFPMKRAPPPPKRRVMDDYDDEEEYDSDLDDFIDDGPEDEAGYSSVIKEIFGYDKSRYRDMDDDVDDMESSFAQQMKEEVRSTKIGIMEDLEDIEKEKQEKRQKELMKKKMMKRK